MVKKFLHGGESGSIPGSGRSPGEGNVNSLQYACLENSMGRRACQESMGSQRVGLDSATNTFTFFYFLYSNRWPCVDPTR